MAEENKTWKTFGNRVPSNDKECFYCKGRLWNGNRTTDHILPKSKGGILSNDNKVFCCTRCNQLKKDYDVEMFRGMVNFLLKELNKEHQERIEYYSTLVTNLDILIKEKRNGKTRKSIPSDTK